MRWRADFCAWVARGIEWVRWGIYEACGVGLCERTIQVYHIEIDYGITDVYVSYDRFLLFTVITSGMLQHW